MYTHSTYFHHQHPPSHTILIHSLHVSASSEHSLIHSTRQLTFFPALLWTSSLLTLSIRDTPKKTSQILHFKNIHFNSLRTSQPYASAPYNAVATITPEYKRRLSPISPILYCPAHISALLWLNPLIHFVYYIPFTSYICRHLRPHKLKIIYFQRFCFHLVPQAFGLHSLSLCS